MVTNKDIHNVSVRTFKKQKIDFYIFRFLTKKNIYNDILSL